MGIQKNMLVPVRMLSICRSEALKPCEDAGNGCHGCHAKAENDSVFISLTMDTMMDIDDMADDMIAGDDTTMDTTTDMTTDTPMDMTTDTPMDMMMKMTVDMETHKCVGQWYASSTSGYRSSSRGGSSYCIFQ